MTTTLINDQRSYKKIFAVITVAAAVLFVAGLMYASTSKVEAANPSSVGLMSGDRITVGTTNGDPDVFIVDNSMHEKNATGYKRVFLNPAICLFYGHFGSGGCFSNMKTISTTVRDSFPTSCYYTNGDTKDGKVWYMEATGGDTGMLRHIQIPGADAVAFDPNFFAKIFEINQLEADWYPKGTAITSASQIPSCTTGTGTPTPTPVSGGISISLASDNPTSATIPQGATGVTMLKFNVFNSNSTPVVISNLTVHRIGSGATTDFTNVYVYQGNNRLTSGRSINSSTNDAEFSSMTASVPANGSTMMSVVAEISTTAAAGNVHALSITKLVASTATAGGTAMGNNFTVSGVDAGTITIAKNGTIGSPKVGEVDVRVAEFVLTAGSTEDLKLMRVALIQTGSLSRSNLSNLKLKDAATGTTLATTAALTDKDLMVFDLPSILIERGNTKVYQVYATISGSARDADTIKIYLEDKSDLLAVGQTYGYGATVTSTTYDGTTACTSASGDCSYSAITVGQVTIVFNGPAAKDLARNAKDVEIMNFNLTAQANIEIRQFSIVVDGGTGTADLYGLNGGSTAVPYYTDIKIIDAATGTAVWGPQDIPTSGSSTSQDLLFTEDVVINAGQTKTYKVTVDVANYDDVSADEELAATIDVSDLASQIKNLDNNTFLAAADIVPGSDLVGNTHTIKVPSLTITLATSPTSQTFIKGTTNVPFVGFNFAAGTAGDVRVTSILTTCYIDDSNVETDFVKGEDVDASGGTTDCQETVPSVRLFVDGVQIGDTKSPSADTGGISTFSNLNLVIPGGSTKVVTVRGDISASAYRNSNVERVAFDLADVSADVTAADPTGTSITAITDAPNGGTSPSRIIKVENTGSITVVLAPTVIDVNDSRIVAAGKDGVTLTQFKFTAQNEELMVTKARIRITSASASADVSDDIVELKLYDGATLVAGPLNLTPASAAGTMDAYADFQNIVGFTVPKDGTKVLTVKAKLQTVSAGADPGDNFGADLAYAQEFKAVGTSGSTTLTSVGSSNLAGNKVYIRKGQPKIELVPLGTSVLINGTQNMLKFKITAIDNDVAIKHIEIQTVLAGAGAVGDPDLDTPTIREEGTGTNIAITSATASTSNAVTFNISFDSEQQISAGNSKTYEFRATLTQATAGDTAATSLLSDTTDYITGDLETLAANATIQDREGTNLIGNDESAASVAFNFIWSDMSAIPHNDTSDGSEDWTTGRYVRGTPTDTQSLTYPAS